jgi:hypothetical protein
MESRLTHFEKLALSKTSCAKAFVEKSASMPGAERSTRPTRRTIVKYQSAWSYPETPTTLFQPLRPPESSARPSCPEELVQAWPDNAATSP